MDIHRKNEAHMNRRRFIQQTGRAAAGTLLLPALLDACKKSEWQEEHPFSGEVIIIGAGISGLYAAEMLIQQGVQVRVLEAGAAWGGRLRSLPTASGAMREAEKRHIRGQFSALYDLLKQQQAPLTLQTGSELYYFNGALNTAEEAAQNTFFNEMLTAVEGLNSADLADISAQAYFDALGLSDNVAAVFNVLTAQVNGTSADHISVAGIAKQFAQWSAGNAVYEIETLQLEQALEKAFAKAIEKTQYNTSIRSIDVSSNKAILTDSADNTYTCDRVLVTIPLDALQRGDVEFNPALSSSKLQAMQRIGIDAAYCSLFNVASPPWQAGTRRIIGTGTVQSFEVTDDGWVYAEVSGTQAQELATITLNPQEFILNEFYQLYPIAQGQVTESSIHVWSGNRSYDAPGTSNAREVMAQPANGKLFFAGEATHKGGHHGTLHGAMETAFRAVTEILSSQPA
jgi:monoamine oxidase